MEEKTQLMHHLSSKKTRTKATFGMLYSLAGSPIVPMLAIYNSVELNVMVYEYIQYYVSILTLLSLFERILYSEIQPNPI